MPEPKVQNFDVLCDECQRLFSEPWDSEYEQNIAGLKMDFFKTPHHTVASLRKAAADGCHICSLFYDRESGNSTPSDDERLLAEIKHSKFAAGDQDWNLEVRVGQYSFGHLKLIPLEGWRSFIP